MCILACVSVAAGSQARERKAGVDVDVLVKTAAETARKKAAAREAAQAPKEEATGLTTADAASKVDKLLQGAFTGSTREETGVEENKYMCVRTPCAMLVMVVLEV